MTQSQQELFKIQFKSIVYVKSEISDNTKYLRQLHAWDKNGSHNKAITKALEQRKELQAKMVKMLNGTTYEEWQRISKRLSVLNSRIKRIKEQQAKYENEILQIPFYP